MLLEVIIHQHAEPSAEQTEQTPTTTSWEILHFNASLRFLEQMNFL